MIHLPPFHPLCAWLRSLTRSWSRRLARRPQPAPIGSPCNQAAMELVEAPEERPKGCGWFDSSYELGHGLLVHEHDATTAAQALAAAPLADWLEFQLGSAGSFRRC
jgi:hypothetical protein